MKTGYHRIPDWFKDAKANEALFRETLREYKLYVGEKACFFQMFNPEMPLERIFRLCDINRDNELRSRIFDFRVGPWSRVVNPEDLLTARLVQGQSLISVGELFKGGYGIASENVLIYLNPPRGAKQKFVSIDFFRSLGLHEDDSI